MGREIAPRAWHTLRLGPMWVFSAITGRCSRFHPMEEAAFWRSVEAAAAVTSGLPHQVLTDMLADRATLFMEFELEDRPVVSGLIAVVAVLREVDHAEARDFRAVLNGLGEDVARIRGPYGQTVSREDAQMLALIAELLSDQPLSSAFETSTA
ncbi:MAG: hypothetical protein ACLGIF_00745 [Actinomycetes bacterium]